MSWACRSRMRVSSAAARTRTRPACSRARSTGSARSARARMRQTSGSIQPGCPSGRRFWRCFCSSRPSGRGWPAVGHRSTQAVLTAPAAVRVAVRGTGGSDTNVEIVAAWRALGIDAALVASNETGRVAATGRRRARAGSTSCRPSTASSPASSSFSGSSGAVSVFSIRPRPSPPLTTSCSLPACLPGRGSLIRAPSIYGPTVDRAGHRTAAGRQATPRQLGRRHLPV